MSRVLGMTKLSLVVIAFAIINHVKAADDKSDEPNILPPQIAMSRLAYAERTIAERDEKIFELNKKIEDLNHQVEKLDQKGLDLMKSYKACSDRMDIIAENEAGEDWSPDITKLAQDLAFLHGENKKFKEQLKKCEKSRKIIKRKYNILKKKADEAPTNCLTPETLEENITKMVKDKNNYQAFIEAATAYGRLLLKVWDGESSEAAEETVEDLQQCQRYVGELKLETSKLRENDACNTIAGEVSVLRGQLEDTREKLDHREGMIMESWGAQQELEEKLSECERKKEEQTSEPAEDVAGENDEEQPKLSLYSAGNVNNQRSKNGGKKTDTDDGKQTAEDLKSCKEELKVAKAEIERLNEDSNSCKENQQKFKTEIQRLNDHSKSRQKKLEEAKEEIKRLNDLNQADADYSIKCKLQKQNIKVSRWYMKKWYFQEVARSTELMKENEHLDGKLSDCTAEAEERPGQEELTNLQNKVTLCEESKRFLQTEKEDLRAQLNHIEPDYKKIKTEHEELSQSFSSCDSERAQLEFKDKGAQMVISQLETDSKSEKEKNKRLEKETKLVIAEADRIRLSFISTVITLVIVITINIYKFIDGRVTADKSGRSKAKPKSDYAKDNAKLSEKALRRASKKLR